ncbi:3-ketoacyl-CoA synthase 17-like [Impatiens glandulifera]|uniref:3-ketoacyl-CoA synthase 17-like n=1 Tax=Impatiens glandulifera TaxID=253017 RepID=UPI001FB11CC8|nr:3-ketoacyl-CoA synthase 17-like [Impatiens glandulifera]
MKNTIRFLQLFLLTLLSFTLFLHATISYTPFLLHPYSLSCAFSLLIIFILRKPKPIYLLNYSCYLPPPRLKTTIESAEVFLRRSEKFTNESVEFMRNIFLKSGLGGETYAPAFIADNNPTPSLSSAVEEARDGVFATVDSVLKKSRVDSDLIDVVIVTSGGFSPSPSLSSEVVRRYDLRSDVKTFNLSGMGCSSGVLSIDLAANILRGNRKIQYILVVISESITSNWYSGDNRSMLVTNCIFRVGCAAALLTNDPNRRLSAKAELTHSLRTHHGSDDSSYRAAFQEEDSENITGVSLTKDLIRVAATNLRRHIRTLAPSVLPLSELLHYLYSSGAAVMAATRGETKTYVPDFTKAFEHICIHTGGKAVIEQVSRVLKFDGSVTEPARMTLHRFGNTSSSMVFYEMAYFEAKRRIKSGDRMWMLAFGTGFKVGSLVWRWARDSGEEEDNPWNDCIDKYPVYIN